MLPAWEGRARLELTRERTYPSGIVLVEYDVRPAEAGDIETTGEWAQS